MRGQHRREQRRRRHCMPPATDRRLPSILPRFRSDRLIVPPLLLVGIRSVLPLVELHSVSREGLARSYLIVMELLVCQSPCKILFAAESRREQDDGAVGKGSSTHATQTLVTKPYVEV